MSVDFAFIDSGTGGLPYMCYLNEKCPSASCIYVADAQNFPYGEKSTDEICTCVTQLCEKIISRFSPKVIVLACNTMSVTALSVLRSKFDVSFIGTVPAIKLASSITKNKKTATDKVDFHRVDRSGSFFVLFVYFKGRYANQFSHLVLAKHNYAYYKADDKINAKV